MPKSQAFLPENPRRHCAVFYVGEVTEKSLPR
jgi:hypothetical protein